MRAGLLVGFVVLPPSAWAHGYIETNTEPFLAGTIDPFLNPVHLFPMVAIGLFAAVSGGNARWAYPASSLVATLLGGLVGYIHPLRDPSVVPLVLVLILGLAFSSLASRSLFVASCSAIVLLGAVNGYVHGLGLPAVGGLPFGLGLLLTMAVLQGIGFLLGFAIGHRRPAVTAAVATLTCLASLLVVIG
jgi:urease accessory protein